MKAIHGNVVILRKQSWRAAPLLQDPVVSWLQSIIKITGRVTWLKRWFEGSLSK